MFNTKTVQIVRRIKRYNKDLIQGLQYDIDSYHVACDNIMRQYQHLNRTVVSKCGEISCIVSSMTDTDMISLFAEYAVMEYDAQTLNAYRREWNKIIKMCEGIQLQLDEIEDMVEADCDTMGMEVTDSLMKEVYSRLGVSEFADDDWQKFTVRMVITDASRNTRGMSQTIWMTGPFVNQYLVRYCK